MDEGIKKGATAAMTSFGLPYLAVVLEPFLQNHPYWTIAFYSAAGLYGLYMQYNQDEVNDFVEFIQSHPEYFTEEIVKTEAFKKGFLITFEHYLKSRSVKKKDIAKRAFLGFTSSEVKEEFKLEAYLNTLSLISLEGIEYIGFLEKEILPARDADIVNEVNRTKASNPLYDVELGLRNLYKQMPLSNYVEKYLDEKFNLNKPEFGYQENASKEEKVECLNKIDKARGVQQTLYEEKMAEYVSLGICRYVVNSWGLGAVGGGSISNDFYFTEFGVDFLKFLKD